MTECKELDERKHEARVKRRVAYQQRRRELIEMGVLPDRPAGRPRLRPPDEAARVAREQKAASRMRTAQLIREGLARRAAEAV
jgi:hypothetical protein